MLNPDLSNAPEFDSKQKYLRVKTCDKGHSLYYFEESPYSKEVRCNMCHVMYIPSLEDPVYHCDSCSYDLCENCNDLK